MTVLLDGGACRAHKRVITISHLRCLHYRRRTRYHSSLHFHLTLAISSMEVCREYRQSLRHQSSSVSWTTSHDQDGKRKVRLWGKMNSNHTQTHDRCRHQTGISRLRPNMPSHHEDLQLDHRRLSSTCRYRLLLSLRGNMRGLTQRPVCRGLNGYNHWIHHRRHSHRRHRCRTDLRGPRSTVRRRYSMLEPDSSLCSRSRRLPLIKWVLVLNQRYQVKARARIR